MSNFNFSKIYKLVDNTSDKVYVGSTCQTELPNRFDDDYKQYLNGNCKYTATFDYVKNGKYNIALLEQYPCKSYAELLARKEYWINKINCVNNKNVVTEKVVPKKEKEFTNYLISFKLKNMHFRVYNANTNEISTMNKLPEDINKLYMLSVNDNIATDEDLLEYAKMFKQWCAE